MPPKENEQPMSKSLRPVGFSGHPVLSQQADLLRAFLGAWPAQGRRLLFINCGNGRLLPRLRENGFDVTACEHAYDARLRAARHAPQGTEIFAASDDHLPFDDGEFDWTLLRIDKQDKAALAPAIAEASRTASRCDHGGCGIRRSACGSPRPRRSSIRGPCRANIGGDGCPVIRGD